MKNQKSIFEAAAATKSAFVNYVNVNRYELRKNYFNIAVLNQMFFYKETYEDACETVSVEQILSKGIQNKEEAKLVIKNLNMCLNKATRKDSIKYYKKELKNAQALIAA